MKPFTIDEINSISYEEFLMNFAGILEHSSIVIAMLWSYAPFTDFADIYRKLCFILDLFPNEGNC